MELICLPNIDLDLVNSLWLKMDETVKSVIKAYDPSQPRNPKGHPDAGKWRETGRYPLFGMRGQGYRILKDILSPVDFRAVQPLTVGFDVRKVSDIGKRQIELLVEDSYNQQDREILAYACDDVVEMGYPTATEFITAQKSQLSDVGSSGTSFSTFVTADGRKWFCKEIERDQILQEQAAQDIFMTMDLPTVKTARYAISGGDFVSDYQVSPFIQGKSGSEYTADSSIYKKKTARYPNA